MNEPRFDPKAEIIRFPEQDIVTTSGGFTGGDLPTRPEGPGIVLPDDDL